MHLPYRSDIDGLRAFAVTSVLIFHAFPSLIPGGFVGVDVFFVISGFLISGILFKELETGSFSFANFYARRVKRIFPALITMLTASYAFGWFFLFNEDFRRLGSHIFRASLFLSNFILWREAGYFDNAAETKPLLHLWSLGIEEQFYIVWPLILWAFWRFKRIRFPLIALLTTCSLVWNIYQSQIDLTHDFYSPLTRFWELSAGAWLAFHLSRRPQTHQFSSVISGFAVLLLVTAVYVIDSKKAFPGGWALIPVVGAVLLIYAGPTAWCNKALFSNRVVVWVGAISYPLYLWHWPVLAFARLVEGATPSVAIRLGAVSVSLVLAWATFVWIEKPIRFGWKSSFRTPLLVVTMGLVGYAGLACKNAGGYGERPIMQARLEANAGDIGHDVFHAYYAKHFFPCVDARIHAKSEKWGDLVRCFQTKRDVPIE
jgi:peptidoglycan/LPS O-acetylase OafA/YrhL